MLAMLAATEMAEQVWRAWERVRSEAVLAAKAMLVAVEAKSRKVSEANCLVIRSLNERLIVLMTVPTWCLKSERAC